MTYKKIVTVLFSFLLGGFLAFFMTIVFMKVKEERQSFQIVVHSKSDSVFIEKSLDTVALLKIEAMISGVEKKNDGRFEVMAWSSASVITILVLFLTLNFFISAARVKELVFEEIDKRSEDIQGKMKIIMEQTEQSSREAEKELDKMRNLSKTLKL